MKRTPTATLTATLTALIALALSALLMTPVQAQEDPAAVATRFAPVVYQEYSIYSDQHLDFLRRVDFDGDWDTTNNLDNAQERRGDERGYVYYDVKETETHLFVSYFFYYARRSLIFDIRKENHSAGCVVVVRKGAPVGQEIELFLETDGGDELRITASNGALDWGRRKLKDERGRTRRVALRKGMSFDDADIGPARRHPRLWIDAWNHQTRIRRRPSRPEPGYPFLTGRGIVYHPHPSVSRHAPRPGDHVTGYTLLPLSQLDQIQTLDSSKRFMLGSKDTTAQLPAAWDLDLPGVSRGEVLKDPAQVVATLFEVKGPFARAYLSPAASKSPSAGITDRLVGAAKE